MIKKIISLFIFWRVLIIIFALLAPFLLPIPKESRIYLGSKLYPKSPYLAWIWGNYDGEHYLYIAKWGYQEFKFAFFPFLPLLIYLVNRLTGISHLAAGILINNLAFFAALAIIYKTILLDYDEKIALKSLFFLAIFPVSFYFGAVYTESLYLLLTSLSFYFARKANWTKAGTLGYLAGITRLQGVALIPGLLIEWWQQNSKPSLKKFLKSKAFFIFFIGLGIITYAVYLQVRYGDFLLFQKNMTIWRQNNFVFPLQAIWRYLKILFLFPRKAELVYWRSVLELSSMVLYFTLSFYVLLKIRLSYGVFMIISLLIPACTGTFESFPRYILHLFPAFLAIALLTSKSKKIFWATTIIFIILGFIFTACFTRGYFIG